MIEIKPLEDATNFYSNIPIFVNKDDIIIDDYVRADSSINGRLDTLIEAFYGTTNHMYLVCLYNDILDLNDVKDGDIIALPNISSLETHIKYVNDATYYITQQPNINTNNTNNQAENSSSNKTYSKHNGIIKF